MSVSDLVDPPGALGRIVERLDEGFLVDGMNGSDQEKNGVLILLGTDGQSGIARVNLFGLGISSLQYVAADAANQIKRGGDPLLRARGARVEEARRPA